jgi:ABC-type branched-subunit amino acid transport system substrate-binding protein
VVLAAIVLAGGCSGSTKGTAKQSAALKVGVLLPLTGVDAVGFREPLELAQENVNKAGGIGGRRVELRYEDVGKEGIASAARRLLSDPAVVAVVGPDTSDGMFTVAPAFASAKKVLVSPSATSAEIYRAFSRNPYVWRTVESDVAQVRALLTLARQGGAHSVSLVTGDDRYGSTFFDWFGFTAAELGLPVRQVVRFDQRTQPCDGSVDQALAGNPDALVAVPATPTVAACMARRWRASSSRARLLFSDAAEAQALLDTLGPAADGLEGTRVDADPASGFDEAFAARFHHPTPPYAASTYDALTLIAYGLQRTGGAGGERLARAMGEVVDGTGAPTGSDAAGVAAALREIRTGRLPNVTGAIGPLRFDKRTHTEPVSSTYAHWRVEGGMFHTIGVLSTADSPAAKEGISEDKETPQASQAAPVSSAYQPGPRTGLWALLVAASDGWDNYRHQADVLAEYQLLRHNGVAADHIVLVAADDLAQNPSNSDRGVVRNSLGGPNLHQGVKPDYQPAQLTAASLLDVLAGHRSAATPKVIDSGKGDDVLVMFVGHGNQNGLYLGLDQPVPRPDQHLSVLGPDTLGATIATMQAQGRYRRMFVAVEACEGGVLGTKLTAPGAFLLAGASPVENSLSTNYDPALRAWLADEFAFELWSQASSNPNESLNDLARGLYHNVSGSHVSAYGAAPGDASGIPLKEFVSP